MCVCCTWGLLAASDEARVLSVLLLLSTWSAVNKPADTRCHESQVVNHFEPAGAAMLLEEEIREALVGTAGTVTGDLRATTVCKLMLKSSSTTLCESMENAVTTMQQLILALRRRTQCDTDTTKGRQSDSCFLPTGHILASLQAGSRSPTAFPLLCLCCTVSAVLCAQ